LGLGVGLVVALVAGEARAEPAESARVRRALHTYYEGEKSGAFQFAVPGLASIGAGTALLAGDTGDVARGAAVPMLAFGAIEVGAGLVLYLRTDALAARLDAQLTQDPRAFKAEETAHLRRVGDQFTGLLWLEIAVAGVGSGMAAIGAYAETSVVQGVGLGLAFEASKLFILDSIADRRAAPYLLALESFRVGRVGEAWSLGFGARF